MIEAASETTLDARVGGAKRHVRVEAFASERRVDRARGRVVARDRAGQAPRGRRVVRGHRRRRDEGAERDRAAPHLESRASHTTVRHGVGDDRPPWRRRRIRIAGPSVGVRSKSCAPCSWSRGPTWRPASVRRRLWRRSAARSRVCAPADHHRDAAARACCRPSGRGTSGHRGSGRPPVASRRRTTVRNAREGSRLVRRSSSCSASTTARPAARGRPNDSTSWRRSRPRGST